MKKRYGINKFPFSASIDLSQSKGLKHYVFKDPILERPRIREVTKNQVGVYIWISKSLKDAPVRAELPLLDYEISFLPTQMSKRHVYVGCAYGDLYTRIIHYFHNHEAKTSPMIRFLRSSGGVSCSTLFVFVITKNKENVPVEVIADLEYYFMQKLNPNINSNLYSLVPPRENLGGRVYVYDKEKINLLYKFRDFVSLVRAVNTKHDTIQRHIKLKTLLLNAFYVSFEPLPQVSTKPHCTELEFVAFAKKTRADFIAKPGGLYGKDKCKKVYIYDKDKTQLLREFPSKEYLEKTVKISHISVNKFAKSGLIFLNSFVVSLKPLENIPLISTCSENDFIDMAKKARENSRGTKILAKNVKSPALSIQFVTQILLAQHFNISISTVNLYLKEKKVFRCQWEFVRLQKR